MNFGRMSCAASVVVAVFLAGQMLGRSPARSEAQVAPAPAPDRTPAQIARDRIKVADEGIRIARNQQQRGVGSSADAAAWVLRRAHAATDLPDKAERIAILQECSTQMTDQIASVQQQIQVGIATSADIRPARFDDLEIELLLAKVREGR